MNYSRESRDKFSMRLLIIVNFNNIAICRYEYFQRLEIDIFTSIGFHESILQLNRIMFPRRYFCRFNCFASAKQNCIDDLYQNLFCNIDSSVRLSKFLSMRKSHTCENYDENAYLFRLIHVRALFFDCRGVIKHSFSYSSSTKRHFNKCKMDLNVLIVYF